MTTTATERPTLSTDEMRALPVGARVEVKDRQSREAWQAGTVVEAGHTPLVEFDGEHGTHAFGWPRYRDGQPTVSAWHVGGGDSIVRMLDAFTFGQRVTATVDGQTFSGIVRGRYAPASDPDVRSWLVCDDSLPSSYPVYATRHPRPNSPSFTFPEDYPSREAGRDAAPWGAWVPERDLIAYASEPVAAPTVPAPTSDNSEAERILRMIGSALAETADRSEWCGEYERLLGELVDSLPYGSLRDAFNEAAQRDRTYSVRVEWSASGSTYVSVTASSAEAAEEMVRDDPWAYVDTYQMRDGVDTDSVEFDSVEVDE